MRPRAVIAAGLIVAFLAAVSLASSPRWHEQIHRGSAPHECAATMIASGNCDHAAPPATAPKLFDAPIVSAVFPCELRLVSSVVRSSILEHAPPPAV